MKKLVLAFLMLFAITACGAEDEPDVEYPVEYYGAEVTGSVVDDDEIVMTIVGEGFYEMTAEVTVSRSTGEITAFTVTDHSESESWGGVLIEKGELSDALVDYSDDLSALSLDDYVVIDEDWASDYDVEAGATVGTTGEAMLDIALGALEHYEAYYE